MPAVQARRTPEIHLPDFEPPSEAIEVQSRFRGITIGAHHLSGGAGRAASFTIGAAKRVHAPAGVEWLMGARHTLVQVGEDGCAIEVTPQMTGEVIWEDRSVPLEAL